MLFVWQASGCGSIYFSFSAPHAQVICYWKYCC